MTIRAWVFCTCFFTSTCVNALDIVKTVPVAGKVDFRHAYAHAMLQLALESSTHQYGPYSIEFKQTSMESDRFLMELQSGDNLSVTMSAVKKDWLDKSVAVHFPLMKGLASYRLFFILNRNAAKIEQVQTLEDLRALRFGQGLGWSTAKILKDHQFTVVTGSTYEGLFPMLQAGRFDLLMRGVQEIGPELSRFGPVVPGLAVADTIAIYTYLPNYFFVSRTQPRLAERLTYGLQEANKKGKVDQLFEQYFAEDIKRLNNTVRKIFFIENTNIDKAHYERDKPYLLNVVQRNLAPRNHDMVVNALH